jgi:hypothetical protein
MSLPLPTTATPTHAQGAASYPTEQEAALEPLYRQQDNRVQRLSPPKQLIMYLDRSTRDHQRKTKRSFPLDNRI